MLIHVFMCFIYYYYYLFIFVAQLPFIYISEIDFYNELAYRKELSCKFFMLCIRIYKPEACTLIN